MCACSVSVRVCVFVSVCAWPHAHVCGCVFVCKQSWEEPKHSIREKRMAELKSRSRESVNKVTEEKMEGRCSLNLSFTYRCTSAS